MTNDSQQAISFGELWSIQESLLQSYRAIFITVEAVIIALLTFLLSEDSPNYFAISPVILLGLIVIMIWMGVCKARARAVTFVHWLIQKHESGEVISHPYSHFRRFQENRTFNGTNVTQDPRFIELSKSKTRQRMDVQLPLLFAGILGLLIVIIISRIFL